MSREKNQRMRKRILAAVGIVIIIGLVFLVMHSSSVQTVPPAKIISAPQPPALVPQVVKPETYHTITIITDNPAAELTAAVGPDNVQMVLEVNRINMDDIVQGKVLVIPDNFSNTAGLSPFPPTLPIAANIPKLMIVSQPVQAFGIYDSGVLVRWGSVSTGKQSTPTPSRLYFTNWKGKSVTSSEDDSWILPWYFNLDNATGVSMHEYDMPGYPASHACIRMFEQDAEWIYNWADQWKVSANGQTIRRLCPIP